MYTSKDEGDLVGKFRALLEKVNKDSGREESIVKLSGTQQRALDLFLEGKSLFVIGFAGAGKSFLIREMKYRLEQEQSNRKMHITATTGVAAYNIGGITINAFMGIGTGEHSLDVLIKRVRRKSGIRERIMSTDVLVIDEISMMSAEMFEKLDGVCRAIRGSKGLFGGIQVVLMGDLLQLQSVFRESAVRTDELDRRILIESELFRRHFGKGNIVALKENFRQSDDKFKGILNRIRLGEHTGDDVKILKTRLGDQTGMDKRVVYLVASNRKAQMINQKNLDGLEGEGLVYESRYTTGGRKEVYDELQRELYVQLEQKGLNKIVLKRGARVMLVKNLNVESGLVNGAVGTIVEFKRTSEGLVPEVRFDNGTVSVIGLANWELELGDSVCSVQQLPLMIAYSLTIHKSQSLTLEKAVLDLADCFCEHMVYVALSRVKSLSGLFLVSFDPKKIIVDKRIKEFLSNYE